MVKPYDIDIKDLVRDNAVEFSRYRKGIAYYVVFSTAHDLRFEFPVPLDDVGDATLLAKDSAILFMRYIRKAVQNGTLVPYSPNRHRE